MKMWHEIILYGVMLTTETSSGFSIYPMLNFTNKLIQSEISQSTDPETSSG